MKKSLLLLTALLLVGAFAFAVDVTPEWSIDLSAYATVGYDFNLKHGGITNSATTDFRFAYFPKATWSKGGEGLYGYIEAKDVQWSIINDLWDTKERAASDDYYSTFADDIKNSAGTVTAKVVYDPIYVLVSRGVDDMRFNYADNADGYADINFFGLEALHTFTVGTKTVKPSTIAFGYGSDMLSARVTVLSVGDYASIPFATQVDKADPSAFFAVGKAHDAGVTQRIVNSLDDFIFGLWVTANPMAMLSVDAKGIFASQHY